MDPTQSWPEPYPPPPHHYPYTAPPPQYHQQQSQPLSSYSSYYPSPNPNPRAAPAAEADPYTPYAYSSSAYNPNPSPVPYYTSPNPAPAQAAMGAPYGGYSAVPAIPTGSGLSPYYHDMIGFDAKVAIGQYGVDPSSYQQGPRRPHIVPPRWRAQSNYKGNTKKQQIGKKQKVNLKKQPEATTQEPEKTPKNRKEALEDDIETKKRKVLEGGAEPSEVKVCTLCGVVVNSQKVYELHIAGMRHAATVKKQQESSAPQ